MKIPTFLAFLTLASSASAWTDFFTFESIKNPPGIDPQVGGMDQMPDGRIAVAFHRGEVMLFDPVKNSWSDFASGLQEPLGLLAEPDGSPLVMQRAELTRIKDTDKDGLADEYETVYDNFGLSGNYHEFAYGPAKDPQGNLYIVLGVASNGAPIAKEIRGEFSEIGRLNREQITNRKDWSKLTNQAGRMYSRVKWRGWVLKLSPDGKKMEPYASGLRSPNGIGFDAKGRLLITDNQGDWRATSPLYEIKKDGFYGHPASLVWKKDWNGSDPDTLKPEEVDQMRAPAIGLFPHGELANSPTWPLLISQTQFPKGMKDQILIGEMNQPTLIRMIGEEVEGVFQTALVPMFDKSPLGMGNNRLVFGKDGSLYVGKTALSWAGSKGITRIQWNGKPFLSLDQIKALPHGFSLKFSQALDESTLKLISAQRHTYQNTASYGGEKKEKALLPIHAVTLAEDGLTVNLDIGPLKEGYLHFLDLSKIRGKAGEAVMGNRVWYHAIKTPK